MSRPRNVVILNEEAALSSPARVRGQAASQRRTPLALTPQPTPYTLAAP